jgi:hypothetical protein
MKTDNWCFYLQKRLIQTSETGGQQYSDTSPLVVPGRGKGAYPLDPWLPVSTLVKTHGLPGLQPYYNKISLG